MRHRTPLGMLTAMAAVSLSSVVFSAAGTPGMTAFDELVWQPIGGGPLQIAKLWGDRDNGPYGAYLKVPAGFKGQLHAHTGHYNGVSIRGVWIHTMNGQSKELPPGSHVAQPGGEFHSDACKGPEECIWFITQDEKADRIAPKN